MSHLPVGGSVCSGNGLGRSFIFLMLMVLPLVTESIDISEAQAQCLQNKMAGAFTRLDLDQRFLLSVLKVVFNHSWDHAFSFCSCKQDVAAGFPITLAQDFPNILLACLYNQSNSRAPIFMTLDWPGEAAAYIPCSAWQNPMIYARTCKIC